jgi:hypothetical protein
MDSHSVNLLLDLHFASEVPTPVSATDLICRHLQSAVIATEPCPTCAGTSRKARQRCRRCAGTGRRITPQAQGSGRDSTKVCPACHGAGCEDCGGHGYVDGRTVDLTGDEGAHASADRYSEAAAVVVRWLLSLHPDVRAAVEASHSPRGAAWRQSLWQARRDGETPDRALTWAPLLPLVCDSKPSTEGETIEALRKAKALGRRVDRAKLRLRELSELTAQNL